MEYNIIILIDTFSKIYHIDIAEIGTGIGYSIKFSKELGFISINDNLGDNLVKLKRKYRNDDILNSYKVSYSFIYDTTKVTDNLFNFSLKMIPKYINEIVVHLCILLYENENLTKTIKEIKKVYCGI